MNASAQHGMELPTLIFEGGETKEFHILLTARNGNDLDLTGATAMFSILESINLHSEPILRKPCTVVEKKQPYLSVKLTPTDTINLSDQFIYQITVKDPVGNVEIFRGYLVIRYNADKKTITDFT